ncbi:MAG: hypothetical protein ACOYJ2_09235 [Rickettsiales bacterium]
MTTPIERYVEALMAYNLAIWANSPAATAGENQEAVNRQNFEALLNAANGYTPPAGTEPLTSIPTELSGKLSGADDVSRLVSANAILTARRALIAAEATLRTANPDTADQIIQVLSVEARARILNQPGETRLGDRTGRYEAGATTGSTPDKTQLVNLGNRIHELATQPIPDAELIQTLNDWIARANLPNETQLASDIREALGSPEVSNLSGFRVDSTNRDRVLDAFRIVNCPSLTATRNQDGTVKHEVIRALRAEQTDASVEVATFWPRLFGSVENVSTATQTAIRGAFGGSRSTTTSSHAPAPQPAGSNDFWQGIQEWFGEMWGNITNIFSGQDGEGVNFGSIAGGGVFGALLYFVAGAFGPIGQFAQWPLAILGFFMGANVGKDWGRDGDDGSTSAPSGGVRPRHPDLSAEEVQRITRPFNNVTVQAAALGAANAGVVPAPDATPAAMAAVIIPPVPASGQSPSAPV